MTGEGPGEARSSRQARPGPRAGHLGRGPKGGLPSALPDLRKGRPRRPSAPPARGDGSCSPAGSSETPASRGRKAGGGGRRALLPLDPRAFPLPSPPQASRAPPRPPSSPSAALPRARPPRPLVPPQRPRRRSVRSPVPPARRRVSSAWLARRRLRPFLAPLRSLKRPFYAPLLLRNSGPETARVSREGGGSTAGGRSASRCGDWLGARAAARAIEEVTRPASLAPPRGARMLPGLTIPSPVTLLGGRERLEWRRTERKGKARRS